MCLRIIKVVLGALNLGAVGCSEVVLGNSPNQPAEVLSELQCLLLFWQGREVALHREAVLHVHLQLVSDPVSIAESHDTLCQLIVGRVHRFVINHV